ncbi:hypothetical protein ACSFBI_18175 [Variovorax sp. RB3P1]|uniref:hypothetical protein n=1 Tax=Variovorax sp. RB3P1 TaxID=3443732 RepID=UPI003F46038B
MELDPPYPDDTGSDFTQVVGNDVAATEAVFSNELGLPVDVITKTARVNPKEFGRGTFPSHIMASLYYEQSIEMTHAENKIFRLEQKIEEKNEELATASEKLGRFDERLGMLKGAEVKTQILNVVAAAFVGVAVDLYKSGTNSLAFLIGAGSLIVLLLPFIDIFMRPKDKNERS